jgi:alkylation response protein AidB-like acyl-CoA dehydrogenase
MVGAANNGWKVITDALAAERVMIGATRMAHLERAFDHLTEYLKTAVVGGKALKNDPVIRDRIGELAADLEVARQFQAVQHKLANCLISLDGARLALEAAAEARDNDNPDWHVFAASALAFAGPALRAVSIETHRALGAIGYAEEHEAPRHFRRVHADLARFGGVRGARAVLADFTLGPAA